MLSKIKRTKEEEKAETLCVPMLLGCLNQVQNKGSYIYNLYKVLSLHQNLPAIFKQDAISHTVSLSVTVFGNDMTALIGKQ